MTPTRRSAIRILSILALLMGGGWAAIQTTAASHSGTSATSVLPTEPVNYVVETDEVFVPAGIFHMGCSYDLSYIKCDGDARPIHTVYLDAFYIDRTEVTNAQYAACVQAGACMEPFGYASATHSDYYTNTTYADYPVLNVDWSQANQYCNWVGKRLPTEAEWEKAARGTDLRLFPWGDDAPTCELGNLTLLNDKYEESRCEQDTVPVGSYPSGASPYGALDMVGNVREWVNDLYESRYYYNSPYYNPQGPAQTAKMEGLVRGGSWKDHIDGGCNTWVRIDEAGIYDHEAIGFRCAKSAPDPSSTPTPTPTPIPTPTPTPTPTPFATRRIGSQGGALWLAYPGHLTLLDVPQGALKTRTKFVITVDDHQNEQGDLQGIGHFVYLEASPPVTTTGTNSQFELTLGFDNLEGLIFNTVQLYHLDSGNWSTSNITVVEKTESHLVAWIEDLGTVYAVLGETNRLYLPIMMRE